MEGEYFVNKVIYPQEDNTIKRTNESFRSRLDENHHRCDSILEELPIDMIKNFPIDYMHAVLLGVTKRIINSWLKGKPPTLLPHRDVMTISSKLFECSTTQPKEFQRKIRGLNDFGYFKATEFRTFLLYAGPIVLKDVLPSEVYCHFLLLHAAISILCNEKLCKDKSGAAKSMLEAFVNETEEIYGRSHLTYNLHSLIHIPDDVNIFGNLDNYSAFEFESEMYVIKRMIRKNNQELAQISNRINERASNFALKLDERNSCYPRYNSKSNTIKRFETEHFRIDDSEKNRWILTKSNNILKFSHMKKVNNNFLIYASEIVDKEDFYKYPIDSSKLNIYQTNTTVSEVKCWNYSDLKAKLFCFKNENALVFFPLIHSL